MQIVKINGPVSDLPSLEPDTVYLAKRGDGCDMAVTDKNGTEALDLNGPFTPASRSEMTETHVILIWVTGSIASTGKLLKKQPQPAHGPTARVWDINKCRLHMTRRTSA